MIIGEFSKIEIDRIFENPILYSFAQNEDVKLLFIDMRAGKFQKICLQKLNKKLRKRRSKALDVKLQKSEMSYRNILQF